MRHLAKCVTDFLAWLIVKWKIETAYSTCRLLIKGIDSLRLGSPKSPKIRRQLAMMLDRKHKSAVSD